MYRYVKATFCSLLDPTQVSFHDLSWIPNLRAKLYLAEIHSKLNNHSKNKSFEKLTYMLV